VGFSRSPFLFFQTIRAPDIFRVGAGGKKTVYSLSAFHGCFRREASGFFSSELNEDVSPTSPLQLQHEDDVSIFLFFFASQT